ncbi:DUF4291 domain-containing protein [Diaphorobacter caeni]|uniref:DUF4291 domain-containing protein n=1 Tax=Diaphorobacter caeni TaxID=2784387 RepID=UPI00188FB805|nr:DUF4291 domain-containing protein [Diaphorobacter caeni]MBF5004489.1 DUF4291 domain-containing protein [Diaphorobacter caeni]
MLETAAHLAQAARWPGTGEHVLAHFDDASVIIYQAYRPSIADFAITHGHFGGPDFSFSRMSWIKPNFLWMMYRCGWCTKPSQEKVLGLRISRPFFESLLRAAVASTFDPQRFASHEAWQQAVADSDVRMQWDPDHAPSGMKLARRAVQLGLRGEALHRFAGDELLEVIDMTDFVNAQRPHARDDEPLLLTPVERVYPWDGEAKG